MHGMISIALPKPIAAFLERFGWPENRIGEAVKELARSSGLPLPRRSEPLHAFSFDGAYAVEHVARQIGIEAEPVETRLSDITTMLGKAGPAIIGFSFGGRRFHFLLVRARGGHITLLDPRLRKENCTATQLRDVMAWRHEAPHLNHVDRLVETAGISSVRAQRARALLLEQRLCNERIDDIWVLRTQASAGLLQQISATGAWSKLSMIVAVFALSYALEIFGWSLIGDAALNGRLDLGWLSAWLLLVLTTVPLRLIGEWYEAVVAVDCGAIIKARLLTGALGINLEAVRSMGSARLLSRVIESQAFETTVLTGAMAGLVALVELTFAAWVLAKGSGGFVHVILLGLCLPIVVCSSYIFYRRLNEWTSVRLEFTYSLIERMNAHRTRLAQEQPDRRDFQEDRLLKDYFDASRRTDHAALPLVVAIPALWTIIGLAGLVPGFIGGASTSTGLAIALGGVLLATRALSSLVSGLSAIVRTVIAWQSIAFIYKAAIEGEAKSSSIDVALLKLREAGRMAAPFIEADDIVFRYEPEGRPIIDNAKLHIASGQRLLFEGPSGGGKSTFVSLLAGLRKPYRGLVHIYGLDRETLGEAWRDIVSQVPQFHDNHILSASLAFNLLMGGEWPPTQAALDEAHGLCVALGLGPTLERMPSGLMQLVGETGWQLSHGEKSRVFLARALLQNAELTILDETFAALDPQTQATCLRVAIAKAKTLLVIAHV